MSSKEKKLKVLKSLVKAEDFRSDITIDFENSENIEVEIGQDLKEEKQGSKFQKFFKQFFRLSSFKVAEERSYFMKKLFARYNLQIKLTLSAVVFLAIFFEITFLLDQKQKFTILESSIKLLTFLIIGIPFILAVSNNDANQGIYFKIMILIITIGGFLLHVSEILYLKYGKEGVSQEL